MASMLDNKVLSHAQQEHYNWRILEIRMASCDTDVCPVDLGIRRKTIFLWQQDCKSFFRDCGERLGMLSDVCTHDVMLTLEANTTYTRTNQQINRLINGPINIIVGTESLKQSHMNFISSIRLTFNVPTTTLTLHDIYTCRGKTNAVHKIAISRLQVIGYNLAIESGH